MKKPPFLTLLLCCLFAGTAAQEHYYDPSTGQEISAAEWKAALPYLDSLYLLEQPLTIALESDFTALNDNKLEAEYQPARLHILVSDQLAVDFPLRIKARGKSRRRMCDYPPIMLNFKKTELQTPGLESLEKVKLVVKCKKEGWYENYVLREYLAYKLLNQLTDWSYRVRLVKIQYRDTGGRKKSWENYGFLIEDIDLLEARCAAKELEEVGPNTWHLANRDQLLLVAVFEYMIGNTDWDLPKAHNLKLLQTGPETGQTFPVPYDFDISGLVDAEYALPQRGLELQNVRERKYLGFCDSEARLQTVLAHFREQEEALLQLVNDFERLRRGERKTIRLYLQEFFREISDERSIQRNFMHDCISVNW